MRKRQIKKYGNTYLIKLSPDDMGDFDLNENDFVDIEDIIKIKEVEHGVKKNNKRN